ncbi:MAG TPA: acetylornithine deacetylase [Thermoanaerobaculia bacterium]|nr:acetylornithine deacetylase [Thermoanaerobaculia bacterium]
MPPLTHVEILRRLISFDTTSSESNLDMADYLCNLLDRPGVEIIRIPAPSEPKANLVIILAPPGYQGSAGLILSGHMDVVPAKEPQWTSDPFRLADTDEHFIGRGTADMKSFIALAALVATRIDPSTLSHPLVLLFTYDEETGTLGAKHFVSTWPRERHLPKLAIIGEPTGNRIVRMHKGHLKLRVTVGGTSAHSGYPQLGDNAIERATRVLVSLSDLRRELESERPPQAGFFPDVPFTSLNIATVHGGSAVNIVPELCEIEIGVRLLPGMDSADAIERIRRAVVRAEPDRADLAIVSDSPPLLLDETSAFYGSLCATIGQSSTESVSFASDAGWLQTLGIECALFGPGSIEVAHRPNEFISKGEIVEAAGILDRMVEMYCRL